MPEKAKEGEKTEKRPSRLQFVFSKEIDDALWEMHTQTRKSRGEIVREALERYLKKEGFLKDS
ncbi:MAG: ribbon-helix-helix protein, CopG family [Candidatus Methanomethylicaceae archaeon]|jgi:hypothetical protein